MCMQASIKWHNIICNLIADVLVQAWYHSARSGQWMDLTLQLYPFSVDSLLHGCSIFSSYMVQKLTISAQFKFNICSSSFLCSFALLYCPDWCTFTSSTIVWWHGDVVYSNPNQLISKVCIIFTIAWHQDTDTTTINIRVISYNAPSQYWSKWSITIII